MDGMEERTMGEVRYSWGRRTGRSGGTFFMVLLALVSATEVCLETEFFLCEARPTTAAAAAPHLTAAAAPHQPPAVAAAAAAPAPAAAAAPAVGA